MTNPFSLDFGAEPNLMIAREEEKRRIIETFSSESPSAHSFILLGARGSGKTVLLTTVSHILRDTGSWIHVDLNVEGDLLQTLAAGLCHSKKVKAKNIKFDLSVKGFGFSMEQDKRYTDIQVDLDSMFQTLQKKKMKVLVTIDEIINSKNVRTFTTYFQHCLREKYSVFLLMTGLYKNVRALQNNKSQTFLKRVPQIFMEPLNAQRIVKQYMDVFSIDENTAFKMEEQTKGYSFGFQLLGYYVFESGKQNVDEDILFEYRLNLAEMSYEKIWEELSNGERTLVKAIGDSPEGITVRAIREKTGFSSNMLSTYQSVLTHSGILKKNGAYGTMGFALPYFKEFIQRQS